MAQKIIKIPDNAVTLRIFGSFDKNIRRVQDAFDVRIYNRVREEEEGDSIVIEGEDTAADMAASVIAYLKKVAILNEDIPEQTVDYVIGMISDGQGQV